MYQMTHGPVPVRGPGLGDLWSRYLSLDTSLCLRSQSLLCSGSRHCSVQHNCAWTWAQGARFLTTSSPGASVLDFSSMPVPKSSMYIFSFCVVQANAQQKPAEEEKQTQLFHSPGPWEPWRPAVWVRGKRPRLWLLAVRASFPSSL